MRKTVYYLMLMALMAGFTACSSSDDVQDVLNDIDDVRNGGSVVIKPEAEVDEFVKAFFSKSIDGDIQRFVSKFEIKDTCILINSEEELKECYSGTLALPTIDFTRYTLVLGQRVRPGSFCEITSHQIRETNDKMILDIMITDFSNIYNVSYDPIMHSFWGLYPKLTVKSLSVNEIYYMKNPWLDVVPVEQEKTELPDWLGKKIEEWEATLDQLSIPTVYKGDWGGNVVYLIFSNAELSACKDVYSADGRRVEWDGNVEDAVKSEVKDWRCVYSAVAKRNIP